MKERWWEAGTGQRGMKGRKKWDKCNSIISKIYFLKRSGKGTLREALIPCS